MLSRSEMAISCPSCAVLTGEWPHVLFSVLMAFLVSGCGDRTESPIETLDGEALSAEALRDPASCKGCHPSHYAEWQGSMHAYSSEDPVFRAMNALGQRETDGALGPFCVQCHAPMALRLGLTTDGTNLDEVPAHLRSVTCVFCHTVDDVRGDHNNPLILSDDGVMRGGIKDPVPNGAHGSGHSEWLDRKALKSSQMCGSCHDIVTPSGVHLEQTYAQWKESLFNDDNPLQRNTCNDCHMAGSDGPIATKGPPRRRHDHSMAAVDVALTPFPQRESYRAKVQRELDTVLAAELCVKRASGGAEIEVYLENLSAGHTFPSGAAHDRRVWGGIIAYADDEIMFSSGLVEEGQPVDELDPDNHWVIYDRTFDSEDKPAHMFWEIARVDSQLLPAPTLPTGTQPNARNAHIGRRFVALGPEPDRVTLRVRMRPVALKVLDHLIASGDLSAHIRNEMPTFDLASTLIEWTPEKGITSTTPLAGRETSCVPGQL